MCCLLLFVSDELELGVPPLAPGDPRELSWWWAVVTPPEGGGGRGGGTAVGGAVVPAGPMSSTGSLQTLTGAGCVGGIAMVQTPATDDVLADTSAGRHRYIDTKSSLKLTEQSTGSARSLFTAWLQYVENSSTINLSAIQHSTAIKQLDNNCKSRR
jgi:hypothetical protein